MPVGPDFIRAPGPFLSREYIEEFFEDAAE